MLLTSAARGAGSLRAGWFLWVPALAAIGMFAMVHIEPRFVAPWTVLIWAAGIYTVARSYDDLTLRWLPSVAAATVILMILILALNTLRVANGYDHRGG